MYKQTEQLALRLSNTCCGQAWPLGETRGDEDGTDVRMAHFFERTKQTFYLLPLNSTEVPFYTIFLNCITILLFLVLKIQLGVSSFMLLQQSTIGRVVHKQQKFTSHSPGGGDLRSGGQRGWGSGEGCSCWLLTVFSHDGKRWGAPWGPFYKGTNSIPEDSLLVTWSPLKGPTS